MSAIVQSAPRDLRDGDWSSERERLGDVTVKTLERFAPGLGRAGRGSAGHHAGGPRERLRPHRRTRAARRARARSVLRLAPAERRGPLPLRARRAVSGRVRVPTPAVASREVRGRTPRDRSARTGAASHRDAAVADCAPSDRPFRIPESTLYRGRGRRVRRVRTRTTCPSYSDWRGSFYKVPWAIDEDAIRGRGADVAIVGAPYDEGVSARPGARFGPKAIRSAHVHEGQSMDAWSIQTEVRSVRRPDGRRRGRRAGRPGPARTQPPGDPREGPARRPRRRDPDRAGRRPLDHVPVGRGRRPGARPGARSASCTSTPTPTRRWTSGAR